ncbi:hypothetical protein P154DRAFT_531573 [Amniculicola lignicola CBS 123094]|uniref:Uncharacterized protein n=1 Tax=Amniculicola lignicola CBS 123094 TaxID=1392246 RepID=A0A6A5WYV0_9PLEO|nr:hypothetical protein P154DRAFT_531573 [Amniculicola lignicola CBS 123094]
MYFSTLLAFTALAGLSVQAYPMAVTPSVPTESFAGLEHRTNLKKDASPEPKADLKKDPMYVYTEKYEYAPGPLRNPRPTKSGLTGEKLPSQFDSLCGGFTEPGSLAEKLCSKIKIQREMYHSSGASLIIVINSTCGVLDAFSEDIAEGLRLECEGN